MMKQIMPPVTRYETNITPFLTFLEFVPSEKSSIGQKEL